jgi:protein subunit release factor A
MPREKVMTVTYKDCEMQTFRCGGKGGQNKDKRDTGVRFVHKPSGARGESRQERTQGRNKRIAFVNMAESERFQRWIKLQHAHQVAAIDDWVDRMMSPENLLIEYGV